MPFCRAFQLKTALEHLLEISLPEKQYSSHKSNFYMTIIEYKKRPAGYPFNKTLNGFIPSPASLLREQPLIGAVNIKETETGYTLDVMAPGFDKENFQVSVEENILTIKAEKKAEETTGKDKFIRKEYNLGAFNRSFTLDKNIDADNISAQYVNGVLTLNLQRKEEVKTGVKAIAIQ